MGEEGRERARSLFDRSAMARRIERLYASVLSDAAPPSGGGHH
jgi:hypothetical protein